MRQKINRQKSASLKQNWNLLVKNIVRPPRRPYDKSDLGSQNFTINEKKFVREDYQLFQQDKVIQLSIFSNSVKRQNIILYLHSNSSNKLQATSLIPYIPCNFSLACFDFFGCGNNHMEEQLTLGFREAEQTKTVVQYLRKMKYRVVLWGRSMGAATALLYGNTEVIVADSAFISFKNALKQASNIYAPAPARMFVKCFFSCIFYKMRSDVKKVGNYDIDDLNIKKAIQKINPNTFLILLSGDHDQIISHENSIKIYNQFKGNNKHLQIFEGTHNSSRPQRIIQKIMLMIQQNLCAQQPKNSHKQLKIGISE